MRAEAIGPAAGSRRRAGLSTILLAVGLFLSTVSPVCADDTVAGRRTAQSCAVCHGELGLSEQPDAPNLAGQPEFYLAEQLRAYRSGERSHAVMNIVAQPLTDAQIDDLASWFASLEVSVKPPE